MGEGGGVVGVYFDWYIIFKKLIDKNKKLT